MQSGARTDLSVLQVDLVSEHDEGEVLRVTRACLDQELVPPAVQSLKGVWRCDVVDQHAAVGAPVERHAQRLKTLLSGCVPNLSINTQNNTKKGD